LWGCVPRAAGPQRGRRLPATPQVAPASNIAKAPDRSRARDLRCTVHNEFQIVCQVMSWCSTTVTRPELRHLWSWQSCTPELQMCPDDQGVNATFTPSRCIVCFECTGSLHDSGCGHGMCLECWAQHAQSKIDDGKGEVTCPQPGCSYPAPEGILRCMLSKKSLSTLSTLRDDSIVASHPSLFYCPDPRCGRVLRSNTDDAAVVNCFCGGTWCPKCKSPAHWPASCDEKRWWDANQGQLVSKMPDNFKVCPSCFVAIEKNGGCNHMNCRMCKVHFCWTCGSFGTSSLSYHKPGVPCRPTAWWQVTLSVLQPSVEFVVPALLAAEQGCRETRERLEQLHDRASSTLWYANGLTNGAIIRHEQRLLEAHRLMSNVLLAKHLRQEQVHRGDEVEICLQKLQDYITSSTAFLRSEQPSPNRMKDLRKRFLTKPHRLSDIVKPLVTALHSKQASETEATMPFRHGTKFLG